MEDMPFMDAEAILKRLINIGLAGRRSPPTKFPGFGRGVRLPPERLAVTVFAETTILRA